LWAVISSLANVLSKGVAAHKVQISGSERDPDPIYHKSLILLIVEFAPSDSSSDNDEESSPSPKKKFKKAKSSSRSSMLSTTSGEIHSPDQDDTRETFNQEDESRDAPETRVSYTTD
jgi:hypothetical protein